MSCVLCSSMCKKFPQTATKNGPKRLPKIGKNARGKTAKTAIMVKAREQKNSGIDKHGIPEIP